MPIAKVKLKSKTLKNVKLKPFKIEIYMMAMKMNIDFSLDGSKGNLTDVVGNSFDVIIGGDYRGHYMVVACKMDYSMMSGRIALERL